MKMDSLNPQDAKSPLGGSTDVRFRQINHREKDFVLWVTQRQRRPKATVPHHETEQIDNETAAETAWFTTDAHSHNESPLTKALNSWQNLPRWSRMIMA
jgi:hypothetical protein